MAAYVNLVADVTGFDLTEPGEGKLMAFKIDKDLISAFLTERLKGLKTLWREFPAGIYDFTNADGGSIDRSEGDMIRVRYIEPGSIPSEITLERLYGLILSAENKVLVDLKGMFTALRDAKASNEEEVAGRDKTLGEKDTEIQRITNVPSVISGEHLRGPSLPNHISIGFSPGIQTGVKVEIDLCRSHDADIVR